MDEEWDNDDFQPKEINIPEAVLVNKWEGEDEDDQVKDNWEDEEEEEEEKKDVEKQELQKSQPQKKGKKALLEKIEEKEQRKREDALKKQVPMEPQRELTPDELAAEKARQQKLQEASDLLVAMETFGVTGVTIDPSATGIDAMNPTTKEEFDEFQDALSKKILQYTKSPHFPGFAEEFIRNICVNLSSYDLKKLKTTIENMFLEKSKVEKGDKAKKKGKVKAKLRVEGENALVNEYSPYDLDDYDDFM